MSKKFWPKMLHFNIKGKASPIKICFSVFPAPIGKRARGRFVSCSWPTRAVRPSLLRRTPRTTTPRVLGAPPPGLVGARRRPRLPTRRPFRARARHVSGRRAFRVCRSPRGLPPPPRGGSAPTLCGCCQATLSCGVCTWAVRRPGLACRTGCRAAPIPPRLGRACAPSPRRRWPPSATCKRRRLGARGTPDLVFRWH